MSFSAQIAGFGERASARIQNVRRGVVMKLFSAVILDTPVDTGRARGNWQVSEGSPVKTATDTEDKSGRGPIAAVEAAAQKSDGDTPLFLSNNLPYIAELENGSSTQQPEGMVRKNVVRFGRLIQIEIKTK